MSDLVEARRDDRLGAREIASLERHLESCASCAALAGDLERIGALARALDPRAERSELEHERGRLRLLRDAAAPARPRRAGVLGVAAVALGVVAGLAVSLALEPARLTLAASAPVPARFVWPAEGTLLAREREGAVERLRLRAGRVDVVVAALAPGERFLVTTDDAEIEVRGTAFRVAATEGRLSALDVREGRVALRREGDAALLERGASWRAPALAAAPAAEDVPPVDASTPSPGAVAAAPPAPGTDPAARDFAEAVRRMERGDYGSAAAALAEFERRHRGDSRGEDAAFLGVVALERAGKKVEAAAAARRYLARYPNGHRRAEARAIAAGASR
jgi:hypothetical protein